MAGRFVLAAAPPSGALDTFDPLTRQLLFTRGMTDADAAAHFFARDYEGGMHDPFLLPDMRPAVERILRAIAEGEHITIYSDYDCDGIPGGVLLHDFFRAIGFEHFDNYIPHRHEEGYGLNVSAMARIKERSASLIITVDCGITDTEAVDAANALGIDVIVTDHHEPAPELPRALAVINPKRADSAYPFDGLCGTGVAWKLVQALLAEGNFSLKPGQEKWLLDVVGIATIADMVPLLDENRLFAHYGLVVMRKGRRLGLQHLLRVARMRAADLAEDDIGFMIGPRINAASRMDAPEDAFNLLVATTDEDAGAYARHLDRVNNERKGVVGAMVKDMKRRLAARDPRSLVVLGDPAWRPSLVGLAANTLAEEYGRPTFVWGRDGRGIIKGSCRSGGGASVVDIMRGAPDLFLEYGGHHASGGFAVKEDRIHALPQALEDAHAALAVSREEPDAAIIDATLSLADVTPALAATLSRFAPFGVANPKPLFLFPGVTPNTVASFGREGAHAKATFGAGRGIEAIVFFKQPHEFGTALASGTPCDLIAHVEQSSFGGRRSLRLRLVDVLPARSFGVS